MEKLESNLTRKAAGGVLVLIVKRVVIQAIFTFSNIFLARLLFPDDFGKWAIVGSFGTFLAVFADIGLGPSLIQKKSQPKNLDIKTAFTFQLIAGMILVILVFLGSGMIASFFNLGGSAELLLRLYSLVFLIAPFRRIPEAILERSLEYQKLVLVDISALLASAVVTVALAFRGIGVFSFVWGLLTGHLMAAILFFLAAAAPLGVRFNVKTLVKLARFGIPFQSQMILGLFYGPLILLYLGKTVGGTNLGFYQFAASLSVLPIAFSEILNRVIFPLGSRTQADKVFLAQAIERSLSLVSMTTLPAIFFVGAVAGQIIHYVYTDRWLAALPALYLGLLQMGVIAYTGAFSQFLLARGHAKVMRNMGVVWAVLTWILAPILIARFNFVGLNLTGLIVSVSGIWLYFRLKREVSFNFGKNFRVYFLASVISSLIVVFGVNTLPQSLAAFVFSLIIGGIVYLILLVLFTKEHLFQNLQLVLSMVFQRKDS